MPSPLSEWDRRELERLYEDAYEDGSGMGARHALLIMFLCERGYSVTNTARALAIAEQLLWGGEYR